MRVPTTSSRAASSSCDKRNASDRVRRPTCDQSLWRRVEWITVFITLAIYGGWLGVTLSYGASAWWIHVIAGAWLLAWHGSLQHETIHGHPTQWQRLNELVGGIPLSLWLPYGLYRNSHIAHHRADLTDPIDDPESYFLLPKTWQTLGVLGRALFWIHATAIGRMVLGPPIALIRFVIDELRRLARGDRSHLRHWALHLVGVALVLAWVVGVCEMPLWFYALAYVYPGAALTSLRSFAEHRPHADPAARSIIVESRILGLLYLNNNLHSLHHAFPREPWYRIPQLYRRDRQAALLENGGYWYPNYLKLVLRYALRPKEHPVLAAADPGDRDPAQRSKEARRDVRNFAHV